MPGKTLLFLDEIQECPEAITSLKFWAADGRYKVIASGLMLGIDYKRPNSYLVGSIRYMDLNPLNFLEFLWAQGVGQPVLDVLEQCFHEKKPVPEAIHRRMMQYLKLYMVIGGMPEVVQKYVDTNNIADTDERQKAILQDYRYDIAHYAPASVKIEAEKCYFSLPDQLGKDNHKFQYPVVEKGGNRRKYESCLDWLSAADLFHYCYSVTKIESPLRTFAKQDGFRIYPRDIGLLAGMYDFSMKQSLLAKDDAYPQVHQAKVGIYEALIADMLMKNGHEELYFYKNDSSRTEIEFLLPSSAGVVPVEVKAGNNRSKSLDRILEHEDISHGYKLIDGNTGVSGKKITMPLYMAM